jgi:hypothetical protein
MEFIQLNLGKKQSFWTNSTQIPTKRLLLFHLDEGTLAEPLFLCKC